MCIPSAEAVDGVILFYNANARLHSTNMTMLGARCRQARYRSFSMLEMSASLSPVVGRHPMHFDGVSVSSPSSPASCLNWSTFAIWWKSMALTEKDHRGQDHRRKCTGSAMECYILLCYFNLRPNPSVRVTFCLRDSFFSLPLFSGGRVLSILQAFSTLCDGKAVPHRSEPCACKMYLRTFSECSCIFGEHLLTILLRTLFPKRRRQLITSSIGRGKWEKDADVRAFPFVRSIFFTRMHLSPNDASWCELHTHTHTLFGTRQ